MRDEVLPTLPNQLDAPRDFLSRAQARVIDARLVRDRL